MLSIDIAHCSGCRLCENNCPTGAIKVTGGKAKINYSICNNCHRCVYVCPNNAIKQKIKPKKEVIVSKKAELTELSILLDDLRDRFEKVEEGLNNMERKRR